jgi:hypothetical protein
MALPTSYLTTARNLEGILNAIRSAQAPEKFTNSFLESLEFKSSSDRLIIGVLKTLGLLDETGKPTERYFRYLDQSQSDNVMAEAMREAYEDLFRVNINAHQMTKPELINKFKTLSQGKLSESVMDKMALTFAALSKHADFSRAPTTAPLDKKDLTDNLHEKAVQVGVGPTDRTTKRVEFGGLVYNIQIVLPESRDPAVYDALFLSMKRHLL